MTEHAIVRSSNPQQPLCSVRANVPYPDAQHLRHAHTWKMSNWYMVALASTLSRCTGPVTCSSPMWMPEEDVAAGDAAGLQLPQEVFMYASRVALLPLKHL